MNGVRTEIARRIWQLRDAGGRPLPPALLLGVMERAAASWLPGACGRAAVHAPFGQQICAAHPMSAVNLALTSPADAERRLGPYGRHVLVTYAVSKYAAQRQVITENSMFFALPALLALFPDAPAAVLTRSPVGVAGSFLRCDLFRRWGYRARYRQISAAAGQAPFRRWAAVVPDDDPPDLAALARLQILNTLILAAQLHDRAAAGRLIVIQYETAVLDPDTAAKELARLVPADPGSRTVSRRRRLSTGLTARDVEEVSDATARALAAGRQAVPGPAFDLAREWAGGGHLYSLTPPPSRQAPRRPRCRGPAGGVPRRPVSWVAGDARGGLLWRDPLVTNDEFAAFLNEMAQAGLPNCVDGSYLLACEMPHERGGQLRCDHRARWWTVSPGFADQPAFWVTWIGAAAFAARSGARLPARAEVIAAPGRTTAGLRVWCADGPGGCGPAMRWLHDAARDRPCDGLCDGHRDGPCDAAAAGHIASAARDAGIRLVRDPGFRPAPSTAAEIAATVHGWLRDLSDRTRRLADLDDTLAAALTHGPRLVRM